MNETTTPPEQQGHRAVLTWALVLLLLAVVTVARVHLVNGLGDQGFFAKYSHFAAAISSGEIPEHRLGDLSPGYLWTLTWLMETLSLDQVDVRTLQIAVVSMVALLCGFTAVRLVGPVAGAVAALAILGSRAALVNATEVEPETLVLLLNSSGLCVLLLARTARGRLAAGLLFGLSAITRPTAVLAAAVLVCWLWWDQGRKTKSTDARAIASAFPLLFTVGIAAPIVILNLVYSSIPGVRTLMNPGTVFFEGANPYTTGLAGDAPRIVKDVEPRFGEPDALHLAYRQVAERSLAGGTEAETNTFWGTRSRAWVAAYPSAWLRVLVRKLTLAVSSYDAWDLATMVRKDRELHSALWLPFGLLVATALVGLALAPRDLLNVPLTLYCGAYLLVMLAFYVTSRQRNPMLPALAILAGVAVQRFVAAWRSGRRRPPTAAAAVLVALTMILAIPGRAQREDRHSWTLSLEAEEAESKAADAGKEGDREAARRWQVQAALRRCDPLPAEEAPHMREAITVLLTMELSDARRFDLALASMRARDWATADRLLRQLEAAGYAPLRGTAAVSSLAYHRARCLLHLGEPETVPELLVAAEGQAPGQSAVLALTAAVAVTHDDEALAMHRSRRLAALHDPFTARLAVAVAAADVGNVEGAHVRLQALIDDYPEWSRPPRLLASGVTTWR